MNIETMIYAYLFVCVSMIMFNIVTAFVLKKRDQRTVRISEKFNDDVLFQLAKIENGEHCDREHKAYLYKKLERVGNMIAFDKMFENVYTDKQETVNQYLSELDDVFIALCKHYCGKNMIEAAYFPYIIKKYRVIAFRTMPSIYDELFEMLDEPSIYCRENVMQAFYTTGDSDCVIRALKKIDRSDLFYHGKLISDGLLNFAGDIKELNDKIVAQFESFSLDMRITLFNYIRFSSPDYCEFAYSLLCDEGQSDEIRYCAIRYLGKYRYDKAYQMLCLLSNDITAKRWQYSAIASAALAIYPNKETINLLKNNLYSRNWHIRLNSAESLERLGVAYTELADVLDGDDRYAAEILRYMLQRKERGAFTV